MGWISFDNGASIGQCGGENGIIVRDEEHVDGARITLERDSHIAPFSIPFGIYGWMVHTCFFSTQQRAEADFKRMKNELANILAIIPFEDDPDLENSQI
jgi:hypothetical protein